MGESTSGVTFREAAIEDVPAIISSRSEDAEWGPADPRTQAYLEGKHHPQLAVAPRTSFVAMGDGAVIGYITGHLTKRYECDGELQTIWVAPVHRGGGTADRLLTLLARWFVEHGARRVCVDVLPTNARARSFYTRHGATPLNPHWLVWSDIGTV